MILFRIKWVIFCVFTVCLITKAEEETKDKYFYKNADGTLSCTNSNDVPFHTENICTQESTILDNIVIPIVYQKTIDAYPTTTQLELSTEPVKIAESSSIRPTGTLVEENSLPIAQTIMFTRNPVHPNLNTQDGSSAEEDILSILPTPTKPISIEEIVAAMEPTIPVDFITSTTVPIYTAAPIGFGEPTGTVIPNDEKETISTTIPPNVILPTKTTTEIILSNTLSTQDVTSTDPQLKVPTATETYATEHTGVIEPTLIVDYTVTSNNIFKTPEPVINTLSGSTLNYFVEPSNTSVIVLESTATPSLPINISKVVVL